MEASSLMPARRAPPSCTSLPELKNASTGLKEGNKDPNYRVYHPNDGVFFLQVLCLKQKDGLQSRSVPKYVG